MIDLHEDGVYFGLPEEEYLADKALGYSGLKELERSPADYWWLSPMNPDRPEPKQSDKDGKAFGSALHKFLLEGVAAYDATYFVPPDVPDGMIYTKEQIAEVLDSAGAGYKKSAKKATLVATLKDVKPDTLIYDEWKAEVERDAGDRAPISPAWDRSIRIMAEIVKRHPQLQNAFRGGVPEVSVFWTEDGVRKRNRYDYLKPHGLFDLKSLSNWRSENYRTACVFEMRRRNYGFQVAHYLDGRAKMIELINQGRVFGDHDPAFLKEIIAAGDAYEFVFVFMQTIGSPRALPLRFPQGGVIHGEFKQKVEKAVASYREYKERFGEDMWIEVDEMWSPTDDDLAPLMWSN